MSRTGEGRRRPAGTVELKVGAQPESLALVRLALGAVAALGGAPSEVAADLKLAVTEACTNAVKHAYPGGEGADAGILVRFTIDPDSLSVEVVDEGIGFDPERVALVLSPDGDRDRGMGLPIIRAVTDAFEIHSDGAGSRLVFSRRFDG